MTRVALRLLALMAILIALMSPAAADPEIGLSRDGVSYTASLSTPLFDSNIRWVPGDSRSETFYVRNEASEPAILSVDVLGAQVDDLLDTGDLTISARGGSGEWRDITSPGRHRVVSKVGIGPGDNSRVDVVVAFAFSSPNSSQVRELDLNFRVLLTQDTSGVAPGDDGLLPDTGAPVPWSLIFGLVLVTGGIILVRSRQEEEDTHV